MTEPKRHEKVSILLVDDQPARLLSYESILKDLGQTLVFARSGVEALEQLMKQEFAVVLLDVSMPGMDGFETAAMIHDHPRYERTPIIFVTGVADTEFDRLKGYKLGAVDYVSIPVVPEILRSKVTVLVELHCQRRELQRLNNSLAAANAGLEQAHSALRAEKSRELEVLNYDLKRANDGLAESNRALQDENVERLRIEQALKEADRHKDEFIAILAHELRNPLAPIRNAIEIMTKVTLEEGPLTWSRDVIERQVSHLSRLVDDLLDISRITRGTIHLNKQPLAVGALIARTLETLQPLIAEHRHELIVNCADESLSIDGDLTRVVQILGNLLNNAAKYTNPGGRIELTVQQHGKSAEFRIKDNGIGIPSESMAKLFNLFARLPDTSQQHHDGLGIGLALVRKLVELHAGEVTVHSAGLNQGSEFVVYLPLTAGKSMNSSDVSMNNSQAPAHVNGKDEPADGKLRILVADDNLDALESLALLLELSGHEVYKACNGKQAVTLAAQQRPDVMLLDIGMPALNGHDVARQIRGEDWGRNITLVAVSGWGQAEDKRRSSDAGFDLHLVKPVDFDSLDKIFAASLIKQRTPGNERAFAQQTHR